MAAIGTANERGVFHVKNVFTDEDGTSVVPDSINWALSYDDGAIVNSRQNVSVVTPAATTVITLTGADLAVIANDSYNRKFALKWQYDSTYGNDQVEYTEVDITIRPLVNVPWVT